MVWKPSIFFLGTKGIFKKEIALKAVIYEIGESKDAHLPTGLGSCACTIYLSSGFCDNPSCAEQS